MKAMNYRDTMELLYLKQGDPDRADFFLFLYLELDENDSSSRL